MRICFAVLLALLVSCGGETADTRMPSTPPPAVAPPSAADARGLVEELYKNHDADQSPFFQTTSRQRVDSYFEKTLADMIWNDAVQSQGEVGALGFDPLYASQDTEITNLAVQPAQLEGRNARVVVTFDNHGTREQIPFSLTVVKGAWKILDIHYSDGSTLRGLYLTNAQLP